MTVRPRCSRGAAIVHMKVSCHPADRALARLATVVSIAASALKGAMMTETVAVAANDESVRPVNGSIRAGELGIEVPKGHIGPVLLSETGRTIWWTGFATSVLGTRSRTVSRLCGCRMCCSGAARSEPWWLRRQNAQRRYWRDQKQGARLVLMNMRRVPSDPAWWPAVGATLERRDPDVCSGECRVSFRSRPWRSVR